MTALTAEFLHQMVSDGFNQLVISHDLTIKRLVGYIDGIDDYYYVLKNTYGSVHEYTNMSAVASLYFLKDSTAPDVYEQLDSLAKMNGADYEVEMIVKKERSKP